MKYLHQNLLRALPLLTLSVGATMCSGGVAQAQPGQPDGDPQPRIAGGRPERQFGRGRGGNRQFGQFQDGRGPQGVVAPRIAVPTVDELTTALDLTPEQQKKMSSVLAEMQKRINNTLTAEQRTKLEQLRTQPQPPRIAAVDGGAFGPRDEEQGPEGRGDVRPEGGPGGFGQGGRGGRQGMGGQGLGGRGFGGPNFGGRGGRQGFGRQGFDGQDMGGFGGGAGMRGPGRGGRQGMRPGEGGPQDGRPEGGRQMQPMGAPDEDHGRPVEAVARELGVTPEQFRAAFRKVHPAGAGQEPTQAQRIANRKVLAETLGVSPERLDEVMDKYRPSGRGTNGPIR